MKTRDFQGCAVTVLAILGALFLVIELTFIELTYRFLRLFGVFKWRSKDATSDVSLRVPLHAPLFLVSADSKGDSGSLSCLFSAVA